MKFTVDYGKIFNMTNVNELLKKLNEEQIKPVLDTEGAVLVIAGAGSGKTRVLTTRIAYLIGEKGVKPYEIAAITFTNKAAGEMKDRLSALVGDISEMWVSTFHSMCVRILRRDADKIGYDTNFTIYDETDKDKVLKRVFENLGYDAEKLLKPAKNAISAAKNECQSPDSFKAANAGLRFAQEIYNVYKEYENELARSNAFDFDDLLFKTYELFCEKPEVADYYSRKFKYIHIDEFQDTNKVQFALAQRLATTHGNIFVVGDDDQSIYGWRGAKIENILSFDDVYRGAKVYKLEQNYRSTKKILSLANCIIANNTGRRPKELWTENGDGARIETFVGTDENNEATYAAIQIKNLMARYPDLKYKDFAVFMRLNALSRAYEQEFTKYNIPYRIFGGFRFFERKEIKDVLSYLKIISNPSDDEAFLRSVAFPKRGIGDKTLRELREYAAGAGLSLYAAAERVDFTGISSAAKTKLFNFKLLLDEFKAYSENHTVAETIEHVLDATGFNEQFAEKTEENTSRLYNVSELVNSADQFAKDNRGSNLADYLNSVTLSSDTDDINEDNAVTIATIHAVKGLEYNCVFISGLDEKILPISRSSGDDAEQEEERRLMYVAVTRARERLYLTRATSRYLYGKREYMLQSKFLDEAKPVLNPSAATNNFADSSNAFGGNSSRYGGESRYGSYGGYGSDSRGDYSESRGGGSGGYSSTYARNFLTGNKPKPVAKSASSDYKDGMKVRHAKFGEGTVINVKGEGDNKLVTVAFKGVGIKQLSVKYAPLERV